MEILSGQHYEDHDGGVDFGFDSSSCVSDKKTNVESKVEHPIHHQFFNSVLNKFDGAQAIDLANEVEKEIFAAKIGITK